MKQPAQIGGQTQVLLMPTHQLPHRSWPLRHLFFLGYHPHFPVSPAHREAECEGKETASHLEFPSRHASCHNQGWSDWRKQRWSSPSSQGHRREPERGPVGTAPSTAWGGLIFMSCTEPANTSPFLNLPRRKVLPGMRRPPQKLALRSWAINSLARLSFLVSQSNKQTKKAHHQNKCAFPAPPESLRLWGSAHFPRKKEVQAPNSPIRGQLQQNPQRGPSREEMEVSLSCIPHDKDSCRLRTPC